MNLRALVFGAGGQAGRAVTQSAPPAATVVGHGSDTLDICDPSSVRDAIRDAQADVLVNCAGWTRVDDAESHPDEAMATNAIALVGMGEAAREWGVRIVHLSTDYVFSGLAGAPYAVGDTPDPLSVYGSSKLEGERKLFLTCPEAVVLRTGWIHDGKGPNFVSKAVRVLQGGSSMRVVDDQIGTPTRAAHLARAIWRVVERTELSGRLHFTDAGVASWYDVAECVLGVLREEGRVEADLAVEPVATAEFPRPATRPRCSVLDKHTSWTQIGWTPPHSRVGVTASTRELLLA